jgi:hypothetical protein
MMKKNRSISAEWKHVTLVLVGLLYALLEPAYSTDTALERQPSIDTTTLLLQQTNPDGGTLTPSIGVHCFGLNAEVVLTAVPKSSYRFLYWMGDVSDPMANTTIVYLDTPKIVIAVFERSEYELLLEEELQNTIGGIGGMRPSAGDYSNQDFSGGWGPQKFKWPQWGQPPQPGPQEIPDEFPVPEEELPDDFPVPHLPEPATILLLGLGSLLFVGCKTGR